jgi:predicted metal-dependent peptidase
LAHEVLHCALAHHCRRGQREPRLWNRAADLAINPLLIANGFHLPAGALIDASFSGMSAEEIYAELNKQETGAQPQAPPQAGCRDGEKGGGGTQKIGGGREASSTDPGRKSSDQHPASDAHTSTGEATFGEVLDAAGAAGESSSEADRVEQQREWSVAAEQALRSAAACGRTPAGVARPLTETRATKLDWRAILHDFIFAQSPQDYRWSPPNRRYVSAGRYLPSIEKTGLGEIVVAVDTSGSVRARELEDFMSEIAAIAEDARPQRIHVVCADAAVQAEAEFAPGEPIAIEAAGGGGTDFRPVFRWVEERGLAPACLIYLTDLRCHCFPDSVEYPVLWVTSSKRRAPIGETIRMEAEQGA